MKDVCCTYWKMDYLPAPKPDEQLTFFDASSLPFSMPSSLPSSTASLRTQTPASLNPSSQGSQLCAKAVHISSGGGIVEQSTQRFTKMRWIPCHSCNVSWIRNGLQQCKEVDHTGEERSAGGRSRSSRVLTR